MGRKEKLEKIQQKSIRRQLEWNLKGSEKNIYKEFSIPNHYQLHEVVKRTQSIISWEIIPYLSGIIKHFDFDDDMIDDCYLVWIMNSEGSDKDLYCN